MNSEVELSFIKLTAAGLATSMKVPEIVQNQSAVCVVDFISSYTPPQWKFMDENQTASSAGHSTASKVPRNSFPAPVPASPRSQAPCCGQNILPTSAVPPGYGPIQSYQNHPGSQPHYKICYDLPAPPGVMGTNVYQTSGYRFPQPPLPYERNPMMGYSVFPPPPPRPFYYTNNPPMVCKPLTQPELLGNISFPYGGGLRSSYQQPYQLFDGNNREDYARQRAPSISPDRTGTVASDERRKTSTSSSKQSSHSSKKTDVKRGTIKSVVQEKSVKNAGERSLDRGSLGRENSGNVLDMISKENTISNERRSSNGTSISSNDEDIQRLDRTGPVQRRAELLKALTENETRQGLSSMRTEPQRKQSEPFALNSEKNNKQGRILKPNTVPDEHRDSGSEPSTQRKTNESQNELSGYQDILLGSMTPQTRASTDSGEDPKLQTLSRQDYSNRSSNQDEAGPDPKNKSKVSPPTSTTDEPQDYRFGMLGLNFSPSTRTHKRNDITDRANATPANAESTKDSSNHDAMIHGNTHAQPSGTPQDRSHSFQLSSSAQNQGPIPRKTTNPNDRAISRKPSRVSNNPRFPKGNADKNYNSGSSGSKINDAKKRRPGKEDYTGSLKRNSKDNSVVDSISNSVKSLPSAVERQMKNEKMKPDVTLQIQVTTRPNQSPEVLVSRESVEENNTLSIVPTSDRGNDAGYTITSTSRNFIDSSCDPRTDSECMPNEFHYHQIKIEGPPASEQGIRMAPFALNSSAPKDNVSLPTATMAEAPNGTSPHGASPASLHVSNTPDPAISTADTINSHSPVNGKHHADGDQLLMLVKLYDTFIQTKERCQCSEKFKALGLTEGQTHLLEELSRMMRPSETNPNPELIKMLISNINLTTGQLEKFYEILTSSKIQSCMRAQTGSIFFQPNVQELVRTPSMSSGSSEGQMFWKKSLDSSPSRSSRRNTVFPASTFRGQSSDSAVTEDSLEIEQPAKRHGRNLRNKEHPAGLEHSPDDFVSHNSRQASDKLEQTTSNLHVTIQEGKNPLNPSLQIDETEAHELLLVAQKLLENAAVRIPSNSSKKSVETSSADPLEAALREYDRNNECCPPPCCANHPRDSSPIPRCLAMAMQNIERIVNSYRLACAPSSLSPKFSPHPYRNIYHPPKSSTSKASVALSKAAKRGNYAPSVSHTTSAFLKANNKTKAKPPSVDTLTPEQRLLLRDLQANPELCQLLNSVPGQPKQQESKKQKSKTKKADPAMIYGLHNTPQMEPASNFEVASKKIETDVDIGKTGIIAETLQKKKSLRDAGKLFETKVVTEEKKDGKVPLDARPSLLSFIGSDLSENPEEEGAGKQDEGGSFQQMPNMPARNLTENDGGTTRMSKKATKQNDDGRLSTGKVNVVSGSKRSAVEGAPQPVQDPQVPSEREKKPKEKLNKPAKK